MKRDKGILPQIPGNYIAQALTTLPKCDTVSDDYLKTVVEVPNFGAVQITFKRFVKNPLVGSTDFWMAVHAATIE